MTAQQLAAKCGELGVPIHRTTITKIENGRPRFDLGELIVLAAALNTSPVVLVYPGPYRYGHHVELTPGLDVPEFYAAQWFSGLEYWRLLTKDDADTAVVQDRKQQMESVRKLNLFREIDHAQKVQINLERRGEFEKDREQIDFYDKLIKRLYRDSGYEVGDD